MIEEVWKREQQAEHEKRKLEEMKKEIQEERKLAELQQDAVDAGHSKKSERLDWMYKGSLAEGTRLEDTKFTRAEGEEEPEELKRERERREDLPPERPERRAEYLAPNMDDPKQRVEQWNKMNNDPLLAMKQREIQARENIASNPVRREQIRREVDERKRRKKEKAREKKERKRAKTFARKRGEKEENPRVVVAGVVTTIVVAAAVVATTTTTTTILPPRLRILEREDEKDAAKNLPREKKEDIHLLHLRGREADHRHLVESQPSKEKKTINTACRTQTSARNRQLRREEIEDMNGARAKKKKNEERRKWNNQNGIRDEITSGTELESFRKKRKRRG